MGTGGVGRWEPVRGWADVTKGKMFAMRLGQFVTNEGFHVTLDK